MIYDFLNSDVLQKKYKYVTLVPFGINSRLYNVDQTEKVQRHQHFIKNENMIRVDNLRGIGKMILLKGVGRVSIRK